MKKLITKSIAVLLAVAFSFTSLCGEELINSDNKEAETFQQPFVLSPLSDGIIAGTGLTLATSSLLCDKVFHIKPNNFSGSTQNMAGVPAFDRVFMNHYNKILDHVGDGVLAITLATPAVMFAHPDSDWLTIGVMYAETIVLAQGIKEWGKLLVNRPRPYMYYDDYPQKEVDRGDWHNSMPSGHTTMAFTAAAFTSAVFNEYFPDSYWRHVVTGVSFGLATSVSIFRMLSGNHFLTDVLTGAAIGTLCGFAVPFFHSSTFHNMTNKNKNVDVAASPLGFNVAVRF